MVDIIQMVLVKEKLFTSSKFSVLKSEKNLRDYDVSQP